MGNRVSIQFKDKFKTKSVVLFSHWDGLDFVKRAQEYAKKLIKEAGKDKVDPLYCLEPNTVMIDFIREITNGEERIKSNYYLGTDEGDGDNSDNGHHIILLEKK